MIDFVNFGGQKDRLHAENGGLRNGTQQDLNKMVDMVKMGGGGGGGGQMQKIIGGKKGTYLLNCFSSRHAIAFVQSIEARCSVDNEDVVGAAPTGAAPTASEWSTILLPKIHLILEVWWFMSLNPLKNRIIKSTDIGEWMCHCFFFRGYLEGFSYRWSWCFYKDKNFIASVAGFYRSIKPNLFGKWKANFIV